MEIGLTKGQVAIVDDEDFPELNLLSWYAFEGPRTFYAGHGFRDEEKRQKRVSMHRKLMGSKDGFVIDHINRNGLDNRGENLRWVSPLENSYNKGPMLGKSSVYKGVSYHKRDEVWVSRIRVNGYLSHLGNFQDELTAAAVYDIAATKYFGEYAYRNFPIKGQQGATK